MKAAGKKAVTADDLNANLLTFGTVIGGVGVYQTMAVVAALGEARLLEPLAVARWADTFAAGLSHDMPPETRAAICAQLTTFAETIRKVGIMPQGAGRA